MKTISKRILAVALAAMLALSLSVAALAADGASGTQSPDDSFATRADVVKWLYSAYGNGAKPTGKAFSDVSADSGAAEAAAWAAGLGIAKGYGDGRFGPDDFVTREQAAAMLYRYAQSVGQGFQGMWMFPLNYPDAAAVSDWANEAMHWVVMKNVITEREAGLAPKDKIGVNELPVWMRNLETALRGEGILLENDGWTLFIPRDIAAQLNTEIPADAPEGTLFYVSEQASLDAARAKGYENAGAGFLFAIQKISEDEAHALFCGDMSGRTVFAKDYEGNYYLFCTPTDVRFERETVEQMFDDQDAWIALNEWAATVPGDFAEASGLIPERRSNTSVDIALNRVAYEQNVKYTVSTLEFGPLVPKSVDPKPFVQRLLNGAAFTYADGMEAPDGEYAVLNFPEEETRFDFFPGTNLIRRVSGEYEELYLAVYDDGETNAAAIMYEWYDALAAAQKLK